MRLGDRCFSIPARLGCEGGRDTTHPVPQLGGLGADASFEIGRHERQAFEAQRRGT